MRNSGWLALAAFVLIPLRASAEEPSAAPAVVLPSKAHALSRVHGRLAADAAKPSGPQRDVAMTTGQPAPIKQTVQRPSPTPRTLRRMAPDRALAAIEPAVRACASFNPTTAPLSFGMRVVVAPGGAVESSALVTGTTAPTAVVACVAAAASAAHFGAPGPNGATIALPITVPGRPPGVVPPSPPPPPRRASRTG